MKSLLTGGNTTLLFNAEVLGRYSVGYYRCDATGFIQTETPYWLDEAYSDAITSLDVGLIRRNIEHAERTIDLITKLRLPTDRLVDFGGGYGLFTRLMRDAGYPFSHFDPSCKNLFASGFGADLGVERLAHRFDLLTAWEVFEHLSNPMETIEQMVGKSDRILFSTILVPGHRLQCATDWWYFTPETGQHISFYTMDSLRYIAKKLSLHFYTDETSIHFFTRKPLTKNPFEEPFIKRYLGQLSLRHFFPGQNRKPRKSLLETDFHDALAKLRKCQETNRRSNESS